MAVLPSGVVLRAADAPSLLTAANATDSESFDSGNVCATYGDRGFVFVKNNCFSPVTVGLEVRATSLSNELLVVRGSLLFLQCYVKGPALYI